ncbi:single-stranded DNA-binding protein [Clostridium magnum]|uniref:single-stranded DNA-binding protein n=1 Tax=Clostridium magnum TaxID=33954 RepID=UPI00091CD284|nr:single-stranded DNA-binding protein [Clostridium magnum]SHJ14266.1 single-strand binding protein [Clostridium magnum DSM 2767]
MNKTILTGRLTKDAELSFTQGSGKAVANFTLAVDSGYGDNKETAFIPVVVWNKTAEAVANNTKKGSKVLVQGRISTRSYDAKDGTKRYVTEVIADAYNGIEFLDGKNNNQTQSNQSSGDNYGEDITPVDDGDIPF